MEIIEVRPWVRVVLVTLVVFAIVFSASLIGIITRPMGHLASFWPSNALLLGAMVRFPALASVAGWVAAIIAYYAADLLTGGHFVSTSLLTLGNFAGVVTGFAIYRRLSKEHRRLGLPQSIAVLFFVILLASAAAGIVGAIANPILFSGTSLDGWMFWFVTELVNYLAILPVVLALPTLAQFRDGLAAKRKMSLQDMLMQLLPIAGVLVLIVLAYFVGGPWAMVFPLPALLWGAMVYGVFGTSLMTLGYAAFALISMSLGYIPIPNINMESFSTLMTFRIGVSIIALGPIAVAAFITANRHMLSRTRQLADIDQLSGLLNRRAFMDEAETALADLSNSKRPCSFIMLDLDHFKSINDNYGHDAGDRALAIFSLCLRESTRSIDIAGRMGGEEFAVILPGADAAVALQVAERIRSSFLAAEITLENTQVLHGTVSGGVSSADDVGYELKRLSRAADNALYAAKREGRNRVSVFKH